MQPADPCTFVIFGASGDLTRRLLIPSLYNLSEAGLLPDQFAVIGFARSESAEDELRRTFKEMVDEAESDPVHEETYNRAMERFEYITSDFNDEAGWQRLAGAIDKSSTAIGSRNCLFYLAVAPEQFLNVCERLAAHKLLDETSHGWRRVIVEKPFGRDLASARDLNQKLAGLMAEHQIYRIDHYLGKEIVQNIMVFRFANGIFEPIWNRRYVDHVQITVAESLGVELRGGYYEQAGALRDMVPNHLFQLLTLTAMEPPSSFAANGLHNEQVKVLDAIEPLVASECGRTSVRAQYDAGRLADTDVVAYRAEEKVDRSSTTETYAAFRIAIDNWRWAGVPFYLRTGKRLTRKKSEVVIQFRQPPLALFRQASMDAPEPNQLVISIQPEESIKLRFAAKVPGPEITTDPVEMRFNYNEHFMAEKQTGYETLLYDAMTGDRSLFKRADMVEAGWAIVEPMLRAWGGDGCALARYSAGSDGPAQADELLARDQRRWRSL
ncbi:MAG TPA: glucose-6-phosphate dehydrogenase [Vicinamibacterales bacterium]|nr:glucose-6-phosphate dehydrogenase [Vicinamibacterales bacterium]